MKDRSTIWMISLAAVVLVVIIGYAVWQKNAPSQYDDFAQCLTEKGAVLYTAYWCGHCQQQERAFGSAYKDLNVVECSSPGSHTFDLCPDIESTPTWKTVDGETYTGALPFETLAEIYGCEDKLP